MHIIRLKTFQNFEDLRWKSDLTSYPLATKYKGSRKMRCALTGGETRRKENIK